MRKRRRWLALLVLLALVLGLPLLLNLEFLRQRVRQGLERQLGREVEVASLTGRLLPRPGVVGRRVRIFDREGFGAEPFLYAEEVRCDLPVRLLWTGRWRCSGIHFFRPSINLVRNSDGMWNVGTFLLSAEAASENPGSTSSPPAVFSASEGRINFKLGADKQVHALTKVKMRLEPGSAGGWRLQLDATPMRGDRRLTETGTLHVRGHTGTAADFFALPVRFQVALDRGSLAQLIVLLTGQDSPLRGQVAASASLTGDPEEWSARVALEVTELRHRDLLASARTPRWQGDFRVEGRDRGRTLEVEEAVVHAEQSNIELTGQVDDPFGDRRWDLKVSAEQLDLAELMGQWSSLKAGVRAAARLDGAARLSLVARGPLREWQGELTTPDSVTLETAGLSQPVEFSDLRLQLERGRLALEPLTVRFSPEEQLTVEGDWQPLAEQRPYRLRWQSQGVALRPLRGMAKAFGWELWSPARWRGQAQLDLEWRGETTGGVTNRWRGQVELRDAEFHPPELNEPLEIPQAQLQWTKDRLRVEPLVVKVGENSVGGVLERPEKGRGWKVKLSAEQLQLGPLDRLLNPARRSLLARLVEPERARLRRWGKLEATGELKVDELVAGSFRLGRFRAQGELREKQLELSPLRFRAGEGRFDGRLSADFRQAPPQYELAGNLKQAQVAELLEASNLGPLFSGLAGADLSLQTSGTRPSQLLRRLEGRIVGVVHDGAIRHFNLLAVLAAAAGAEPDGADAQTTTTALQSLAGEFLVANQQVELDRARLIVDGAALEVSGRVSFEGGLNLRLSGEPLRVAGRPVVPRFPEIFGPSYRLRGTLERPQVQLAEPPPATEE